MDEFRTYREQITDSISDIIVYLFLFLFSFDSLLSIDFERSLLDQFETYFAFIVVILFILSILLNLKIKLDMRKKKHYLEVTEKEIILNGSFRNKRIKYDEIKSIRKEDNLGGKIYITLNNVNSSLVVIREIYDVTSNDIYRKIKLRIKSLSSDLEGE